MLRALLAAIKPVPIQQSLVELAVSLAERHKLALDACTVVDVDRLAPAESVPIGADAFKAERDAHRIAQAHEQAAAALAHLKAAAQARSVVCRSAALEGDTPDVLAQAAQRCDLVLCGHSVDVEDRDPRLLQAILKHSPRPAIVVPQTLPSGTGAVVAYDGSFQAARALASFVASGLAGDRSVHVVSIGEDAKLARRHVEAAQAYLERHEVPCSVEIKQPSGRLGDQILEEAARRSAGLLVMGSFGRSGLSEFFLGSVTRQVLSALTIPVFLDH
jgi:nucleotide-binding universal stress UspA family protein